MREVTDPTILAQLNAPQTQVAPAGMREVTDPAILAQLNGTQAPSSGGIGSFIQGNLQDDARMFGNVENGILGVGDALRNTLAAGANIIPGVNISPVKSGQGSAYGLGNIAGNIAGFVGGGELLDTARAASEAAPYIGKAAQWLGKNSIGSTAARQGLGNAIYGGLATNDDRFDNAIKGGIFGGALGAVSPIVGKIADSQLFMPGKYAQGIISDINSTANQISSQDYAKSLINNLNSASAGSSKDMATNILQGLGSGQSLADNSKSIAQAVNTAFTGRKEEGRGLYNSIFNNLSDSTIYDKVKTSDPFMSTDAFPGYTGFYRKSENVLNTNQYDGQYPNLSKSIFNSYNSDLNSAHNNFLNNPTLGNAHTLQSQLGSEISSLNKSNARGNLSVSDKNILGNYITAKNSIKSDINSYLKNAGSGAADSYQAATENWKNNVAPYFSRPKISQMANGNVENIGNIQTPFKNPSANVQKVIQDLGEPIQNKIIYSQLGKMTPSSSPQNLVNAFNRLDEQGLGQYVTPELSQRMSQLQDAINHENFLNYMNSKYDSENPQSLIDAFKNLQNKDMGQYATQTLASQIGELQNRMSREDFINKINIAQGEKPEELINTYKDIKKSPLQNFATPYLDSRIGTLQRNIFATKALQGLSGAALGASIGNHLLGAGAWGALAGIAAPQTMRFIQESFPNAINKASVAGSSAARYIYPKARTAFLSNNLNYAGGQS